MRHRALTTLDPSAAEATGAELTASSGAPRLWTDLDPHERLAWRWTFRGLLVITLGAVLTNRLFYADGCQYFFDILQNEGFDVFASSRCYAQYATQAPVVAAIKLGVSQRLVLAWIFGATLYGLPLLALWACYRLAEPKRLIIYPMLAYLTAYLTEFTPIVNELHMMFAVFWVLLFLLLRERTGVGAKVAILGLAFFFSRLYEASFFLAPLLLLLTYWRLRGETGMRSKAYWIAVSAILLFDLGVAGHEILVPRDATNKGNFLEAAVLLWIWNRHIYVYAGLFALAALASRRQKAFTPRALRWAAYATTAITLFYFYGRPQDLRVFASLTSRPLLLMVSLALTLPLLHLHRIGYRRPVAPRALWLAATLLAAYQIGVHTNITVQWHGYQQVFRTVLAEESERGVVDVRDTVLARQQIGNQLVAALSWDWTMPALSVVLAPEGKVSTVVDNKNAEYRRLDPYDLPAFPDRYGIEYVYKARHATAAAGSRATPAPTK